MIFFDNFIDHGVGSKARSINNAAPKFIKKGPKGMPIVMPNGSTLAAAYDDFGS